MSSSYLDSRSSSTAIATERPRLAVLPIGACEQHGPHLPIGTDVITAAWLAQVVSREVGAFQLPVIAYGTSAEHRGFPGTMSLRPETLAAVVTDISDSCAASGIRRLAVVSGHGGNWILKPAIRDINARHPDRSVGLVPESVIWADTFTDDLHAGATETSIVLHLDPGAVGELPQDFVPSAPREALDFLSMQALTPDGVWGSPSQASADQGAKFLAGMAQRVAEYLRTTFTRLAEQREEALI